MNPIQNIDKMKSKISVRSSIKKDEQKSSVKKNSKGISLKPLVTEKAVMLIESQNVLIFETEKETTKEQVKKEIEDLFEVKVEKIRTLIRLNKKHAYVKLKKGFPALDLATKLGLM